MNLPFAVAENGKPFSFPRESRPMPAPDAVRVPSIAEVPALLEWAFPLIQARYPRAMLSPVRQMVAHAAGGPANPPMKVWCTANALGLAIAERDCFEPQWQVRTKFLVHRDAPDEARLIRAALRDWAQTIGAISCDEASPFAPEPKSAASATAPVRKRR